MGRHGDGETRRVMLSPEGGLAPAVLAACRPNQSTVSPSPRLRVPVRVSVSPCPRVSVSLFPFSSLTFSPCSLYYCLIPKVTNQAHSGG